MNRRTFLRRFGIGLTAAAALSQIPEHVLCILSPSEAAKRSALAYLTRIWNMEMKGEGSGWSIVTSVAPGLWNAMNAEMVCHQRYVPGDAQGDQIPNEHALMFKAGKVYLDPTLRGWDSRWIFSHATKPRRGSFWDGNIEFPTSGFNEQIFEFHRNTDAHKNGTCSCYTNLG